MDDFAPIETVAHKLDGFSKPWFVSGGWAIDLFIGSVTRVHEDLEVGIFRCDQAALYQHFARSAKMSKLVTEAGKADWVTWEMGEWLVLPIFQIKVVPSDAAPPEFEFFLNDMTEAEEWQFRRNPVISRPVSDLIHMSKLGIPVIAPEVQLLHKAKYHRPKDDHDFERALPLLDAPR